MSGKKITLTFEEGALNFLTYTLDSHAKTIQMVNMNPLFKEELIDDISKIRITLNNAKKGV